MLTETYPKTLTLKDGSTVQLRTLAHSDLDPLLSFYKSLQDEDRIFLRDDVDDPGLMRKWTDELDSDDVTPLVVLDGDQIVASASLYVMPHEWMRHVGNIRVVTARSHRHRGLGGLIVRELVSLDQDLELEKLQVHAIQDNKGAIKMLAAVGFQTVAVLEGMVKDRSWNTRNLVIMVNDVANLTRIMEDWIQQSMQPGYRAPGGGA